MPFSLEVDLRSLVKTAQCAQLTARCTVVVKILITLSGQIFEMVLQIWLIFQVFELEVIRKCNFGD